MFDSGLIAGNMERRAGLALHVLVGALLKRHRHSCLRWKMNLSTHKIDGVDSIRAKYEPCAFHVYIANYVYNCIFNPVILLVLCAFLFTVAVATLEFSFARGVCALCRM